MNTAEWSVNRLAAAAVVRHSSSVGKARELLAMVGLVDESRTLLPDDTKTYALGDPGPSQVKDADPVSPRAMAEHGRRPAGMTTPAGLATLQPVLEQPAPKKRRQPSQRPSKPARPPAPCGTLAGYMRHQRAKSRHGRDGEKPCRACKDAKNAYYRARDAERRATGERVPRPYNKDAKCGTRGGYEKHRRLHTAICDACRAANAIRGAA